jgi:hypothetical protein
MLDWLTCILFRTSCMPVASTVCWLWLFVWEKWGGIWCDLCPRQENYLHLWVYSPSLPCVQLCQKLSCIPKVARIALEYPSPCKPEWNPSLIPWWKEAVHRATRCSTQVWPVAMLAALMKQKGETDPTERPGDFWGPGAGLLSPPLLWFGCSILQTRIQ